MTKEEIQQNTSNKICNTLLRKIKEDIKKRNLYHASQLKVIVH